MTLEELEAEAMKLDQAARAELLRRLAASLAGPSSGADAQPAPAPPPPTDEQREREWLQGALRRSRELRERQVQTEPPDRRPAPAGDTRLTEIRPALRARAKPKSKPKPKPKSKSRSRSRPAAKKRAASRPKPKPKFAPRLGKPRSARPRAKSRPKRHRR